MPDDSIDEITQRLNRALTMSQPSGSSSSNGLNETQKKQIRDMVEDMLRERNDNLLDEGTDQPIGRVSSNLEELEKVPDVVRSIREFSGKPGEFNSWRKSVDRVLSLFETLRGTGRYYAILHVIRTKIIGDADTALESYRTPLDWIKIRKCLMIHYSDRRDIGTLEYQMTALCQGNKTINDFYQTVYQHLSVILDKVACLDFKEETLSAMTNTYREKALDTFIRGLNGDLSRLLSIREPTSLPQALHICLKLDNMTYRRNYAQFQNSKVNGQRSRVEMPNLTSGRAFYPELTHTGFTRPPLPPRYHTAVNHNSQNQNFVRSNFNPPRFQFNSNGFTGQSYRNEYNNYRKTPGIEPMDVDRSIQTRQVNYMNRPPINQNTKRPAGTSFQGPVNKMQRNFHINADYVPADEWYGWTDYPPEGNEVDVQPTNNEEDYIQEYLQHIREEDDGPGERNDEQPDDVQLAVNFLG